MQDPHEHDPYAPRPPTPAELDDLYRDEPVLAATTVTTDQSRDPEFRAAAENLARAFQRYAAVNNTTTEQVLIGLAVGNGLYNPERLRALNAPKELIKGMEIARRRGLR